MRCMWQLLLLPRSTGRTDSSLYLVVGSNREYSPLSIAIAIAIAIAVAVATRLEEEEEECVPAYLQMIRYDTIR